MLLIAIQSSSDRFNQPYFFNTSEKVSDFFTLTFKFSLLDIVSKLECFCLLGVKGILVSIPYNIADDLSLLLQVDLLNETLPSWNSRKWPLWSMGSFVKKICPLINLLILEVEKITGTKTQMFYTNFDNNITDKYRVIVKHWPLISFLRSWWHPHCHRAQSFIQCMGVWYSSFLLNDYGWGYKMVKLTALNIFSTPLRIWIRSHYCQYKYTELMS